MIDLRLFASCWWITLFARSCSVPVANFRIYFRTGVERNVRLSIVARRSWCASWRDVASGNELLTKPRSKISYGVGVLGLSASGIISWAVVRSALCGLNENNPAPRHADSMFWVLNTSYQALIYASIHSCFCIRTSCASFKCWSYAVSRFFSGPKIATSSGWRRWDVWGGRIKSIILFRRQWGIKLPLICELWPSQIRSRYPPFAFVRVVGSKTRFNHPNLWRLFV